MFLKITAARGYQYLKLVESYREEGKVKQRQIANLGRLEHLKKGGQLTTIGKRLLALDGKNFPTIDELQELNRLCYGDLVYKKLWDKYQFTGLLKDINKSRRVQYDFWQTVYLLVIDRLLHPRSKLALFQHQGKYLNIQEVPLQHLYRCLDILCEAKEQIESHIFNRQRNLFNLKIDVVFYDVTTYHFESVRADELKEFGFSKAGKFNEVQVVMGLLLDMEGHPIGFDLFPGNTHDSKTLLVALEALKKRFFIRRLIFIADQGINSKANLHKIKKAGYDYIVSARIKNFSEKLKEQIHRLEDYVVLHKDSEGKVSFRYKVISDHRFTYQDEDGIKHQLKDNLVIYWSSDRAAKDALDRERQIRKAEKMITSHKNPSNKKGYRRYIATRGEPEIIGLDEDRIVVDHLWDGYAGLQSSKGDLDVKAVIDAYHQLWRIETSFRVFKSSMQTRPIYHWTPRRIKGHFVVCFLAFVLERALENKLQSHKQEVSPERIKEALNSLEVSEIKLDDQLYYLKSKNHPLASKILNILRIKHLKNVTAKEEFAAVVE